MILGLFVSKYWYIIYYKIIELPYGHLDGIKNTIPKPASFASIPWAAGGIFDTTLAPIRYFYNNQYWLESIENTNSIE